MTSPTPRLHDVDAAAALLAVSTKTVRRLISRGELRAVRIGVRGLVSSDEIKPYIAALAAAGGAAA